MKKYFWVGLLMISSSAFAIFEDEDARKKINEIQDQLNNIQDSIEYSLKEKFLKLENNLKKDEEEKQLNNQAEKQLSRKNFLELVNKINAIYDELARLNGEVEVLRYQVQNSEERQKTLYQELNDRLLNLESIPIKNISTNIPEKQLSMEELKLTNIDNFQQPQADQNPDVIPNEVSNLPPLIDKNIEFDAFSEADALLKATKYKESFVAFDKFVSSYPQSEFIVKAKFNLGYSQFALKNYNAAIKTYLRIIELHTDNSKLPEVIYQIANCEIQLTRITRAKNTLRGLIKKYPKADITSSARRRLKALESIKL